MRRITSGEAFTETLRRAKELVFSGADDDAAIEELQRVAGCVEVLVECETAFADQHGFPVDTMRRWFRAAAGQQLSPLPVEQVEREAEQRVLLAMPPARAFRLLNEREPMLADLERQAGDWTSVRLTGIARFLALVARGEAGKRRAVAGQLLESARTLVGPASFQVDPLLASPAAAAVVRRRIGLLLDLIDDDQERA